MCTGICHRFGWARMHPVASRIQSHETLSLLFVRDGVLPLSKVSSTRSPGMLPVS